MIQRVNHTLPRHQMVSLSYQIHQLNLIASDFPILGGVCQGRCRPASPCGEATHELEIPEAFSNFIFPTHQLHTVSGIKFAFVVQSLAACSRLSQTRLSESWSELRAITGTLHQTAAQHG